MGTKSKRNKIKISLTITKNSKYRLLRLNFTTSRNPNIVFIFASFVITKLASSIPVNSSGRRASLATSASRSSRAPNSAICRVDLSARGSTEAVFLALQRKFVNQKDQIFISEHHAWNIPPHLVKNM